MDRNYLLRSDQAARAVELWSETRLPFDNLTPALKKMREELRAALGALAAADGEVLKGVFASTLEDACDVENVLFYNVGPSIFRRSSPNGVRFEQAPAVPPLAGAPGINGRNYHRYEFTTPSEDWRYWREESGLATLPETQVPSITSETKVHQIWSLLSPVRTLRDAQVVSKRGAFGIRMRVQVPSETAANATSIMKPLLDAAISSCHVHDGRDLTTLARRLGEQLRASPSVMADRLMDDSNAVLGRRRLLWPRGAGIQWNPADDACVAASIDIVPVRAGENHWSVSGVLFDASPALTANELTG
jgi:hypothetical protein